MTAGSGRIVPLALVPLPLRLAVRELRGGIKGFRLLVVGLALGVAAVAAVGVMSAAVLDGLARDGRMMLGGDVRLSLVHREINAEERDWIEDYGKISEVTRLRSMASRVPEANVGASGIPPVLPVLVELKAVDKVYPMIGMVTLDPPMPVQQALTPSQGPDGKWGAVVSDDLLQRLDLAVGDELQVGALSYRINAVLVSESDRADSLFPLGPRVMVARDSLAATGLLMPGSLVHYDYRVLFSPGQSNQADQLDQSGQSTTPILPWLTLLEDRFPDAGWHIHHRDNAAPGLRRFVYRLNVFLTLVGIVALILGGVGVAIAVRAHLSAKTKSIAILKSLGASGTEIFTIYLFQVMILALLGVVIGLMVGVAAPVGLLWLLPNLMPEIANSLLSSISLATLATPVALAAASGLLTALAFAVWPLARAREVPAARLFRQLVAPDKLLPRWPYMATSFGALAVLVYLAVFQSLSINLGAAFIGAAIAAAIVLAGAGGLLIIVARRMPRQKAVARRLALTSVGRSGSSARAVVTAMGTGLTMLVLAGMVEGNLGNFVAARQSVEAPAFFFIDIQPDQINALGELVAAEPEARELRQMPSLRGRLVAIDGVPADQVEAAPNARWVLRGDRALSFSAAPPPDTLIEAGEWWPQDYSGAPQVSVDANVAHGLGLDVGDYLTVNVLGRPVSAKVTSLRRINWLDMAMNFALIFSPDSFAGAPHSYIATVVAPPDSEDDLFEKVASKFANISIIRVREALQTVNSLLARVGGAGQGIGLLGLVAGLLVLAGAVAAGQRDRQRDMVILKVLGATRTDILRAYLWEYALLGLTAAIAAAVLGTAISYVVVTHILTIEWSIQWGPLAFVLGLGVIGTMIVGFVGTWRILGQPAAPFLRDR